MRRWRSGYLAIRCHWCSALTLLSLIPGVPVWVMQVSAVLVVLVVLVAGWTRANCQTVATAHLYRLPTAHARPRHRGPARNCVDFLEHGLKRGLGQEQRRLWVRMFWARFWARHTSRLGPAVTLSRRCGESRGIFAVRRYSGAADDPATAARPSHC